MSEWYEADDIALDPESKEVNILVTSNDFGNVYVTMAWDQLDAIYEEKQEWVKDMSDFREIFKIIDSEKSKWMGEHGEEKIREMVRVTLDNTNINTILKICGFEMERTHWKEKDMPHWRIDHCNNRSGNSPVGDMISNAIGPTLKDFLRGFDTLSDAEKAQLKSEAHNQYIKQYKRTLEGEARKSAQDHARAFIQKEIDNSLSGEAEKIRLIMKDRDNE